RSVALKLMRAALAADAQLLRAFEDEARIMARLTHPRIVRVIEWGEDRGLLFIAMEHVPGVDLGQVLAALRGAGRPPPLDAVASIADDLLAGLHAAHELRDQRGRLVGLVHRDVTPQNLLVCGAGEAKLTDFGIAKSLLQAHVTE